MNQNKSKELYQRAIKVIPGGTQTLSKYYDRFKFDGAPAYLSNAEGCYIIDIDENKYIDWSGALGPVVLGYNKYVYRGVNSSLFFFIVPNSLPLPIEEEVELAELLCDIIPCAEMVRFFKTGSDATSAAVRLARAVTGRGNVLCCGYHGWHDWYAETLPYPKNKGITVAGLYGKTRKVEYGDLEQLKTALMDFRPACFILEPMCRLCPEKANKGYLESVKELCREWGVVLIFDEIIMGFRHALAGGQELYGVTPDLATYSKAMANGYSISVLVGKKLIMKELKDMQVSGTYFGETIGIKAALQTIKFIMKNNVIDYLWKKGNRLINGITLLIDKYDLYDIVEIKGFGPWSTLVFKEEKNKQIFLKEVINKGIYFTGEHFVTYSHTDEHIERTLEVYEYAFNFLIM